MIQFYKEDIIKLDITIDDRPGSLADAVALLDPFIDQIASDSINVDGEKSNWKSYVRVKKPYSFEDLENAVKKLSKDKNNNILGAKKPEKIG